MVLGEFQLKKLQNIELDIGKKQVYLLSFNQINMRLASLKFIISFFMIFTISSINSFAKAWRLNGKLTFKQDTLFVVVRGWPKIEKINFYHSIVISNNLLLIPVIKKIPKDSNSFANLISMRKIKVQDYEGRYTVFISERGRKIAEGWCDGESFNGTYKEYHTNGHIKIEGYWINGVKVGKWKYYYKNGKLKNEIEYTEIGNTNG
jgi:hypothetical protein